MAFIDEIPDLTRDIKFAMWFLSVLSMSERNKLIKEELFDELNNVRDRLFTFMDKWDLREFKKEYFEKYWVEYNHKVNHEKERI